MASEEYGARLTADPSGFVAGAREAEQAQKRLNDEIGKSGGASKSAAEQSREFSKGMKEQEQSVISGANATRALEAATGRLPPALRAAAAAGGVWALAAVAIGVATYELVKRHNEHEQALSRIQAAFAGQGRAFELSRGQLRSLTDETSLLAGMTDDTATRTVAAYSSVRSLGGAAIAELSRLTADYAVATGRDVPAAAQALAKALADPVKGAKELDAKLGLLNASQLIAVERFSAFGQSAEAQGVLIDALRDRVKGLNEQALGPLARQLQQIRSLYGSQIVNEGVMLQGYIPSMSQVYGSRGFTGDARDLQLAAGADRARQGYALAAQYDTEGRKRLQLEGARSQLEGALGERGQAPEYYDSVARAIAKVNDELAKLDSKDGGGNEKIQQFQRLMASATAFAESLEQEASGAEKATQAEEKMVAVKAALEAGTLKLNGAQQAELYATLERGKAAELAIRLTKEEAKADDERNKVLSEGRRVQAGYQAAAADAEVETARFIDNIEFETSLIGLNSAERQKAIALRALETKAVILGREEYEKERAALIRAFNDQAAAQSAHAAAEAAANEWDKSFKRTSDNIERALTDAIMRGGRNGRELLEAAMRTAVLTPIISPIVRPVAQLASGLVNGALGSLGAPGYAGGSSGGAGALGALAGGSQLFADFGNYFGNIGAATEAGGTYTAGQAFSGFAGAHPYLPYLGAGMLALQGNTEGALFSAGGTALGAMVGGPVGAYIGGALGTALGGSMGGGDGDAMRSGRYIAGFGADPGWGAFTDTRWFSGAEMGPALMGFSAAQATREQNLIRNLGLSPQEIARVNAGLSGANNAYFGYGMEHTPVEQSGAFEQISATRLQAISSVLGRSIQELTQVMSMSAGQWQQAIQNLQATQAQAESQLGQMVRALPGQLGITTLEGYQASLGMAENNAPLDRLSAARASYEKTLARARSGDLEAINAFPGAAQSLLGIGRDVYASGSGFQDIFVSVNQALNQVLDQQRATQADLLKDVPATIMQASIDQVAAMKSGFADVVASLDAVKKELTRMRAASA